MGDKLRDGVVLGVVRGVGRADTVPAGLESSWTIRSFSLSSATNHSQFNQSISRLAFSLFEILNQYRQSIPSFKRLN